MTRAAALTRLMALPDPPELHRAHRITHQGTWTYGRQALKHRLACAWLAARLEAHGHDASEVISKAVVAAAPIPAPLSVDEQLDLVLAGLEREWRMLWRTP